MIRLSGGEVPFGALVQLRGAAEASYVTSVRIALVGATLVLLASAAFCGRTLETRVHELDDA